MITQEMKAKGIHCKGKGLNCWNCPYKDKCIEYVEMDMPKVKPPLGVMPKHIYELVRIQDLCRAINDHAFCKKSEHNYPLMMEWSAELQERIKNLSEMNMNKVNIKKYKCHKIVEAEPMTREEFYGLGTAEKLEDFITKGYKIKHKDGYVDWVTKKAFERDYTLL